MSSHRDLRPLPPTSQTSIKDMITRMQSGQEVKLNDAIPPPPPRKSSTKKVSKNDSAVSCGLITVIVVQLSLSSALIGIYSIYEGN